MKIARFLIQTGLSAALIASVTACGGGNNQPEEAKPFEESEWQVVVQTAFPLNDSQDGTISAVRSLSIGNYESELDPFANRGNIEVLYDQPGETIVIEMRKFAFEVTEEEAQTQYGKMHAWAYESPANIRKPSDMDDEDSCIPLYSQLPSPSADEEEAASRSLALPVSHPMYAALAGPWRSGCAFIMYFDGLSQPARIGTDIRVHLPIAYTGSLDIETQDNDEEDLYPRRGDVRVDGLCGNGDIAVTNGNVDVRICPNLNIAPGCSAEVVSTCEMQGWDPNCGCTEYGQLKIESRDPFASNITIDVPPGKWIRGLLANEEDSQIPGDEATCVATVEQCDPNTCTLEQSDQTPWKATVDLSYPGAPAIAGGGYNIAATSKGCAAVPYVNGPSDYDPAGEPDSERRGNVRMCMGCLTQ